MSITSENFLNGTIMPVYDDDGDLFASSVAEILDSIDERRRRLEELMTALRWTENAVKGGYRTLMTMYSESALLGAQSKLDEGETLLREGLRWLDVSYREPSPSRVSSSEEEEGEEVEEDEEDEEDSSVNDHERDNVHIKTEPSTEGEVKQELETNVKDAIKIEPSCCLIAEIDSLKIEDNDETQAHHYVSRTQCEECKVGGSSIESSCEYHLEECAEHIYGQSIEELFFYPEYSLPKQCLKLEDDESWVFVTKNKRILYEYPYSNILDAVRYITSRKSWGMRLMRFRNDELELIWDGIIRDHVDHVDAEGNVYIKHDSFSDNRVYSFKM